MLIIASDFVTNSYVESRGSSCKKIISPSSKDNRAIYTRKNKTRL